MLREGVSAFLLLAGAAAQPAQQAYTDELTKLTRLTDNKQFKEAINGYRQLQSQPGTPDWLKAASEFEIAQLDAALRETGDAVAALGRAVQLGFDDCLAPRSSEQLAAVLSDPAAAQAIAKMQIAEADFRELVWLKSEIQHVHHDGRMMITENINRADHGATEIPQAQIPARPTNSPAVLYGREQLRLVQRSQRAFVQQADLLRISHVTKMAIIAGGSSASAALRSARLAQAAAESRRLEIRKRAFVPAVISSDQPKPCVDWK